MHATDRQTDVRQTDLRCQTDVRQKHRLMPLPYRGGGIIMLPSLALESNASSETININQSITLILGTSP